MYRSLILCATLAVAVLATQPAWAGSMMTELENAAKLGSKDGPKADQVKFTLHFGTDSETIAITGRDFDSFKLHDRDGVPTHLELFAGSGEEKHNILINIDASTYYRLNIVKQYKEWHYDFHFYF
ncbi:MAG: hypothetical protein GY911_03060 [Actinomycetales bacterium]|nr:hypothetical protein [Actinomycetales bacterium]